MLLAIEQCIEALKKSGSGQIDLSSCSLTDSDIQPLWGYLIENPNVAKKIISLFLNNNQLTSITIPKELVALEWVYLNDNQLTSITIELVGLLELNLDNNQLTSITIPKELVKLKWLSLKDNQLTSISIPKELVVLQWVYLNSNQLTSITIPKELVGLECLHLNNNQLTSITIELVGLLELNLNNQLTSITIPKELVKLKWLSLKDNQLIRITIPKELVALQLVHLNNNHLKPIYHTILKAYCRRKWDRGINGINESIDFSFATFKEHFMNKQAFRTIICSMPAGLIKSVLLEKISALALISVHINGLNKPEENRDLKDVIYKICEYQYTPIIQALVPCPYSEIEAMQEAFTFDVPVAEFTDALNIVNEFANSEEGSALLFSSKSKRDEIIMNEKTFDNNLFVAFSSMVNDYGKLYKYINGEFKSDETIKPSGKAFYMSMQNILSEYGLPRNLITPKELLEVIKPCLVQMNRVRKTTAPRL